MHQGTLISDDVMEGEFWRELRVGDKVVVTKFPSEFNAFGYHIDPETRAVYESLVAMQMHLTVERIDDDGLPWTSFTLPSVEYPGTDEHHDLALNHGGLERAV